MVYANISHNRYYRKQSVKLKFRVITIVSVLFIMALLSLASTVLGSILIWGNDRFIIGPIYVITLSFSALLIIFMQWMVSPDILDFTLKYAFKSHIIPYSKLNEETFPDWFTKYISSMVEKTNITIKKLIILDDLTSTAFVYGHNRGNARLVISKGLLKYLNKEELKSVIGHEISHIKNRDFIWVTMASGFPLICAYSYTFFREVSSTHMGFAIPILYPVLQLLAILNYILYVLAQFILLALTRVRESLADHGSVLLGNTPNALSYSLLKIGYGLLDISEQMPEGEFSGIFPDLGTNKESLNEDNEIKSFNSKEKIRKVVYTLGFTSNVQEKTYIQPHGTPKQRVAKVLNWERKNPISRFIQLYSSHPLISERIKAMDELSLSLGHQPLLDIENQRNFRKYLSSTFLIDVLFTVVNWLPIILIFTTLLLLMEINYIDSPKGYLLGSISIIGFGIYWLVWNFHKFPMQMKLTNTREIIEADEKDPLFKVGINKRRGVMLKGRVLGRLIPGYSLGKDFVIVDNDVSIIGIWQSSSGLVGELHFATKTLKNYEGREVKIKGWLSRMPMPILFVKEIKIQNNEKLIRKVANKVNVWNYIGSIITIITGLLLINEQYDLISLLFS
ncbi:MAG: M48 family metalloprotease [Candidatus Heimdallarchaeota archaeon]|nr:M48 family metalloprotease [Candidatus Heimdallarchaeota archaeon]